MNNILMTRRRKKQRNRLIKMFRLDAGNASDAKYAQKINAAYEIIKKSLN